MLIKHHDCNFKSYGLDEVFLEIDRNFVQVISDSIFKAS